MTRITLNNQTEPQGITVTQQDNVQSLAVEQVDNAQEIPVSPDVKFLRGFSPTIEVEEVMGGFNVTITDAEHTEAVFIASGGEVSEEQVKEAVNAYLAENPVSGGATAEQAEQIEQNRVDILALVEALKNIEIPEVDLSDYAKKDEVPSIDGLASEAYVKGYAQPKGDYLTDFTETDPTVPAWAKAATKPSYTADEVGAEHSGAVSAHNVATDAHSDIRLFLKDLTERVNALADSDDETLDQMSEVVAYIKDNRDLIEQVTTGKVSVGDIVDNLTTNVSDRPLSAAQGVALKALIDAITVPTKVSELANDANYLTAVPEEFVTEDELNAKGYLTEHQPLGDYVKSGELAAVAKSGSYSDLSNKPTIPTIHVVTSAPSASVGKDGDIALVIGG